jgi:SSS family solute:Na+ symporter
MTWVDGAIVGAYLLALVGISLHRRARTDDESAYLLGGRTLTLPAFVATLVSTWYGGILGVGEFGYLYGMSQWVVFGLPFYVFALAFAWFLAPVVRKAAFVSIPDAVAAQHGPAAGKWAAAGVAVMVSPAPYLLMIALMVRFWMPDWPLMAVVAAAAAFISGYVMLGGFRAVVNTDRLQVGLMYAGFAVLVGYAWAEVGSPAHVWEMLPESHRDPAGGHSAAYILVWFFIALWTFVDPGFHQRCAAAKTPAVARKGIVLSVGFWLVFDILTVTAALYGRVMFPALEAPAAVYPEMAARLLPAGVSGLFIVALLATIMSTLDSFLFLSGQTLGRDLTRIGTPAGIVAGAALGVGLVALLPDVIGLWYALGTVVIPGLLLPVLGAYIPVFRVRRAAWLMAAASGTSLAWMLLLHEATGIEPFYPGIAVAVVWWAWGRLATR